VLTEALLWAVMPAASFLLVGVPILHAHTKMMLGSQLAFARTPKQAEPTTGR
jgi:hypothetical protein